MLRLLHARINTKALRSARFCYVEFLLLLLLLPPLSYLFSSFFFSSFSVEYRAIDGPTKANICTQTNRHTNRKKKIEERKSMLILSTIGLLMRLDFLFFFFAMFVVDGDGHIYACILTHTKWTMCLQHTHLAFVFVFSITDHLVWSKTERQRELVRVKLLWYARRQTI